MSMMNLRLPLIASGVIFALMCVISGWAWYALPSDVILPIHWNMRGEVDDQASKEVALVLLPATAFLLSALMAVFTRIEPRRSNLAKSSKLYVSGWIGALLLLLGAHVAVVLHGFGIEVSVHRVLHPTIAVFFIILGNYLGKTRSNFFAGIRTPWTLSSDYSWERTHRLGGRFFVIAGLLALGLSLGVGAPWDFYALAGGLLVTVIVTVIMSYIYWRRDPERQTGNSNA